MLWLRSLEALQDNSISRESVLVWRVIVYQDKVESFLWEREWFDVGGEMTVTSTEYWDKEPGWQDMTDPRGSRVSVCGVVCGGANQQIRGKRRGFKTDINHKLLSKYRTMEVRLGNDGPECLEPVNRAHFRTIPRCNNKAAGLHLNFCEILSLHIYCKPEQILLLRAESLLTSVRWENICKAELSSELTGGGWGEE